ncbi:MAG: DUF4388 domain-containing protein, partial [Okeania sp. SIO2D1]|nr:DUF4388 domain-containing protein [Okeania sp. SIO2D1]
DQGRKTGLLTVCDLSDSQSGTTHCHYLWLSQGRIVGAANRLDNQALLSLINQRGWLSTRIIARILKVCSLNMPLGMYLKSQGLLQAQQLKLLFSEQVLRQICALFTLENGYFEFDRNSPIPMIEMTGLSTPATEVTLAGLRTLRDWSKLQDKLPEPTSALSSCSEGKPMIRLDKLEWQVWEFTNGTISVAEISEHLALPTQKVQQIAFRLMVVGLVEEVPMIFSGNPLLATPADFRGESDPELEIESNSLLQSFVENIVGFLRSNL